MTPAIRVDGRRRQVWIDGRPIDRTFYSSRHVFVDEVTGIVVKLGNAYQCRNEARLWKEVRDTEWARHFAPVVAHGMSWVAQRLIVHNGHRTQRRIAEVERAARKFGVYDMWDGNWLVQDRCAVIVDYGVWSHEERGRTVYL